MLNRSLTISAEDCFGIITKEISARNQADSIMNGKDSAEKSSCIWPSPQGPSRFCAQLARAETLTMLLATTCWATQSWARISFSPSLGTLKPMVLRRVTPQMIWWSCFMCPFVRATSLTPPTQLWSCTRGSENRCGIGYWLHWILMTLTCCSSQRQLSSWIWLGRTRTRTYISCDNLWTDSAMSRE